MRAGPREAVIEPLATEDLPSLFDLYRRVVTFPPPDSVGEYWQWRYRRNPLDEGRCPPFVVARLQGRLVGALARMPVVLDVQGHPIAASWAADFMVDRAHRGQGLGRRLFGHCRAANGMVMSMGYAPDSATSRIARSVGFDWYPPFPYLFKFYTLKPLAARLPRLFHFVGRIPGALRPFLGKGNRWTRERHPDVRLVEVSRFDQTFDTLWSRVTDTLAIVVRRTPATMNWRYFENPFFRYRAMTAWRGDDLVGCLVLKVVRGDRFSYGTIPEIVVPESEVAAQETLLAWALEEFERAGVDVVKSLVSAPHLSRLFRRAGFLPLGKSDFVFALGPGLGHTHPEAHFAREGWYLTKGDGDLDIAPDFMTRMEQRAPASQG